MYYIFVFINMLNRLEHCPEEVEQGTDSRDHKIGHSSAEIESLFVSIF